MKFDGILFDVDGTLWDSCRNATESWRLTLLDRYGAENHPSQADMRSIMGCTCDQIARRLFSDFGDRKNEVCAACLHDETVYLAVHGGDVYPGVEEMLRRLSLQTKLFIVSNCQDGYIESFLAYSGYGRFFTDHECEGHSGLGKADNIRLLVSRHGLRSPVYVGDTLSDEQSAKAAGCPFIHAAYGFGTAEAPMASAGSVPELMQIIESF